MTKLDKAIEALQEALTGLPLAEAIQGAERAREALHAASPLASQPINRVRWVPIADVVPNSYNPNSVAATEMRLLYTSIKADGYTQPIVTVFNPETSKYEIVDGFHRYYTAKTNPDILERNCGLLPIVVIDKPINDRMASTVRHNRARGKHSVTGMSSMVFQMLENGWADDAICNELGMEPEELIRLKHITGFSKLFKDVEYKAAWETRRQIKARQEHDRQHGASPVGGAAQRASASEGTPTPAKPARVRQRPAQADVRPVAEDPAPRKRTRA